MGGFLPGDRYSNALFENPGFNNHWITIKLIGKQSNSSAIGTLIRIEVQEEGKSQTIYKTVNSGGSFGANPLRQTVGLGKASQIQQLHIYWPTTGQTQTFSNLSVDQNIQIIESENSYKQLELKSFHLSSLSNDN